MGQANQSMHPGYPGLSLSLALVPDTKRPPDRWPRNVAARGRGMHTLHSIMPASPAIPTFPFTPPRPGRPGRPEIAIWKQADCMPLPPPPPASPAACGRGTRYTGIPDWPDTARLSMRRSSQSCSADSSIILGTASDILVSLHSPSPLTCCSSLSTSTTTPGCPAPATVARALSLLQKTSLIDFDRAAATSHRIAPRPIRATTFHFSPNLPSPLIFVTANANANVVDVEDHARANARYCPRLHLRQQASTLLASLDPTLLLLSRKRHG